MSRPISQQMQDAIAAVRGGMTAYAAAKKFCVAQSGLSRQLHKPVITNCAQCGHPTKGTPSAAERAANFADARVIIKYAQPAGNDQSCG